MNMEMLNDKRALALLSRVRDDLSGLREDMARLVRHTGSRTLPDAVRSGREQAREFARDGIDRAGRVVREHPASVSLGSVLLVGAMAAGVWWLVNGGGSTPANKR